MKPYPAYKDSGVEWLGQVPEGWEVAPVKRRFFVRLGKMLQPASKAEGDFEAPYLRAANIQWTGADLTDIKTMWFSSSEAETLDLQSGDLLVSEGGDVGRSALLEDNLEGVYFQNSVNRVRPRANDSTRFLYYWMAAIKESGYVDVLCNKSTIAHFTAEKVEAVPVPLPPVSEQQAIAAFLDRETAKIDGLIEEQRRLIALLAEKRQATISHAVTRGLNPSARLKPSGVDWLGDIPEGWEVVPIMSVADVIDPNPSHRNPEYVDDGFPFISTQEFLPRGQILIDTPRRVTESTVQEQEDRCKFKVGSIAFSRKGTIGEVRALPIGVRLALLDSLCVINPKDGIEPSFLLNALTADYVISQYSSMTRGAALPQLSVGRVRSLKVVLPPLRIQRQIISRLQDDVKAIDDLIGDATAAVALLQERRSALISAAVTGKINVRDLALVSEAA